MHNQFKGEYRRHKEKTKDNAFKITFMIIALSIAFLLIA